MSHAEGRTCEQIDAEADAAEADRDSARSDLALAKVGIGIANAREKEARAEIAPLRAALNAAEASVVEMREKLATTENRLTAKWAVEVVNRKAVEAERDRLLRTRRLMVAFARSMKAKRDAALARVAALEGETRRIFAVLTLKEDALRRLATAVVILSDDAEGTSIDYRVALDLANTAGAARACLEWSSGVLLASAPACGARAEGAMP